MPAHIHEDQMIWTLLADNGHRGPQWKNNHARVAYMNHAGEWHEERHYTGEPLVGVIAWAPITDPDA